MRHGGMEAWRHGGMRLFVCCSPCEVMYVCVCGLHHLYILYNGDKLKLSSGNFPGAGRGLYRAGLKCYIMAYLL